MWVIRALGSVILSLLSSSELQFPTTNPIIRNHHLYTVDMVPFYLYFLTDFQLEALGYHISDSGLPSITTKMYIESFDESIVSGTVYFEYGHNAPDLVTNPCEHGNEFTYSQSFDFNSNDHDDDPWITIEHEEFIHESGVWITTIYVCVDRMDYPISTLVDLNGSGFRLYFDEQTVNPLGHLGFGSVALPFLLAMTLIHGSNCFLYIYCTIRYRSNWSPSIHRLLFVGIMGAFIESALRFSLYKSYNLYGEFSPSYLGFLALSSSASWMCQFFVRIALMTLSCGYRIVHPTMPRPVMAFNVIWSVGFIIIHSMLQWVQMGVLDVYDDDIALLLRHSILVIHVMWDVFLCWFVIEQILDVGEYLHKLRNMVKANLYLQLFVCTASCFILSMGAVVMNVWIHYNQLTKNPHYWSIHWFLEEGVWRLIALIFSISISCIWKPQRHSLEYEEVTHGLMSRREKVPTTMRANPLKWESVYVPTQFDDFLSHSDQERMLESDNEIDDSLSSVGGTPSAAGKRKNTSHGNLSKGGCPDIENFLRFKQMYASNMSMY